MALRRTMALALAAAVACGAAAAQDDAEALSPGGKAVMVRQGHYKDLGKAFVGLSSELRKDAPDKAAISAGTTTVNSLAQDLPSWFPKGSGPEAGVKTAAKAEIWTDAAGFAAAARNLQVEAAKLQAVALGGDLDAVRAQVRATGAACKACHDQYRQPEQR